MTILIQYWWQIWLAGTIFSVFGFIWYSKFVFGHIWISVNKLDPQQPYGTPARRARIYGISYLCYIGLSWLICWVTCATDCGGMFVGVWQSLRIGILIGLAMAAAITLNYMCLSKHPALYLIDCGFYIIGCKLIAFVFYLLGCC